MLFIFAKQISKSPKGYFTLNLRKKNRFDFFFLVGMKSTGEYCIELYWIEAWRLTICHTRSTMCYAFLFYLDHFCRWCVSYWKCYALLEFFYFWVFFNSQNVNCAFGILLSIGFLLTDFNFSFVLEVLMWYFQKVSEMLNFQWFFFHFVKFKFHV